jgi:N6-adenosine-specific RNA methylase IME4
MTDDTQLVPLGSAFRELADANDLTSVKDIRAKAASLEAYAKEAKDSELMDHAVEVRLRAERKAGQLLIEMAESGDRATREGNLARGSVLRLRDAPTLTDLGVEKNQSWRWRKLAGLNDDEFVQRLAEARHRAWSSIEQSPEERQAEKRERRETRERELGEKQLAYPDKLYGLILCDDEWDHEVWSRETGMDRHASNHYPTATDAHTADEMHERTKDRFTPAPDCLLAMWTTNQHLAIAIDLMRLRGFRYVTNYAWGKDKIGLGYWSREKHELLLLGVRGQVPCPAPGRQLDSLIMAPRGEHSVKPECFLEMLELYFPTLPKIEINCVGAPRPGWDAWGNEAVM